MQPCEQCGQPTPGGGFCYECSRYEEWLADQMAAATDEAVRERAVQQPAEQKVSGGEYPW